MRWLKHLALAHSDKAVACVLEELGAEAYGVWWLIVEEIAAPMEPGKMEPNASHSLVKWAQICHCSVRRFMSIAGALTNQNLIGFKSDLNRVTIAIPNILKYKDEYTQRSGETPDKLTTQSGVTPDKPKSADEVKVWFETEFYPIFPLHKAPAPGLKAARSKLHTPELRAKALAALKEQLPELSAREPSMRPYPATWINERRWEDEPLPLFNGIQAKSAKQIERERRDEMWANA